MPELDIERPPAADAGFIDSDWIGRNEAQTAEGPAQLLDAQTGDGSGDDELLDLLGAFEDVVGLDLPSVRCCGMSFRTV